MVDVIAAISPLHKVRCENGRRRKGRHASSKAHAASPATLSTPSNAFQHPPHSAPKFTTPSGLHPSQSRNWISPMSALSWLWSW